MDKPEFTTDLVYLECAKHKERGLDKTMEKHAQKAIRATKPTCSTLQLYKDRIKLQGGKEDLMLVNIQQMRELKEYLILMLVSKITTKKKYSLITMKFKSLNGYTNILYDVTQFLKKREEPEKKLAGVEEEMLAEANAEAGKNMKEKTKKKVNNVKPEVKEVSEAPNEEQVTISQSDEKQTSQDRYDMNSNEKSYLPRLKVSNQGVFSDVFWEPRRSNVDYIRRIQQTNNRMIWNNQKLIFVRNEDSDYYSSLTSDNESSSEGATIRKENGRIAPFNYIEYHPNKREVIQDSLGNPIQILRPRRYQNSRMQW